MEEKEIKVGDSLFDEFGNEYIVESGCQGTGWFVERKIPKIVTHYVNIFYDEKYDQMTTGITYQDRETAKRNGSVDPNYIKTIPIDNQKEGEGNK